METASSLYCLNTLPAGFRSAGVHAGDPALPEPVIRSPIPRPLPERLPMPPARDRDGLCGGVRIQDGPHLSRKDTTA